MVTRLWFIWLSCVHSHIGWLVLSSYIYIIFIWLFSFYFFQRKLYSFFYNFIYVCIFGCARSLLMFTGLSLVVALRLYGAGSVVVTHRLSFQAACEVFLPGPRIEPIFPTLLGRLLMTGPPGKPTYMVTFNCIFENIFLKIKMPTRSIHNFYNI